MNVSARHLLPAAVGLAALVLCGAPADAGAVTTATWKTAGREAFLATETESLSVGSDGVVGLGPAFDSVEGIDDGFVWSLRALSGTGRRRGLIAGTGNRAALYSVDGAASRGALRATRITRLVALQVNAIVEAPDGTLFLGTGPDGTLYRLAPGDSVPRVFCDLPERHVWGLLREPSGALVAATGDGAKLYRIDSSGTARLLYEGSQDHFTSLASWRGRTVVGADNEGLLYAVDADGRAALLMDAAEQEVKAVVVTPDGQLYAAVNPPPGEGGGAEPDEAGRRRTAKPVVYRVLENGVVETVWSAPDATIQALAVDDGGQLWVATGATTAGGLFRIDPATGAWALMGRPGPPQLLSLALDAGRLFVGTGGPGRVYRLELDGSPLGRMISTVHDAKQLSDWGVLRFDAGERPKGRLSFRTRSGLSARPDDSWSIWSAPLSVADGAPITSPPGRYLQWEATLERAGSETPELWEVSAAYRQRNQAPVVRAVNASPLGTPLQRGGEDGGPQPVVQSLPGNLRVEFSVGSVRDRFAEDDQAAWARRFRTIRWDAADPNEDALVYRLEVRARGETGWQLVKDDLRESVFAWDSGMVPDGRYVLRVTASDRLQNPADEGREASRESVVLTVDNTPPAIDGYSAVRDGGTVRGTATVSDAIGPLRTLEVAVDGGAWLPVNPADAVLDQSRETARFAVPVPLEGEHVVVLRATDAAGNVAVARAMIPGGTLK